MAVRFLFIIFVTDVDAYAVFVTSVTGFVGYVDLVDLFTDVVGHVEFVDLVNVHEPVLDASKDLVDLVEDLGDISGAGGFTPPPGGFWLLDGRPACLLALPRLVSI